MVCPRFPRPRFPRPRFPPAGEHGAEGAVVVVHPGLDGDRLAALQGGLGLLDQVVIERLVEAVVLGLAVGDGDLQAGLGVSPMFQPIGRSVGRGEQQRGRQPTLLKDKPTGGVASCLSANRKSLTLSLIPEDRKAKQDHSDVPLPPCGSPRHHLAILRGRCRSRDTPM